MLLLTVTDLVQVTTDSDIPEDSDCVVGEKYASGIIRDPLAFIEDDRLLPSQMSISALLGDEVPSRAEHVHNLVYLNAELCQRESHGKARWTRAADDDLRLLHSYRALWRRMYFCVCMCVCVAPFQCLG